MLPSEMLAEMEMEATKMASNQTTYNNLTPAQNLDKKTLNKMNEALAQRATAKEVSADVTAESSDTLVNN